MDRGNGWLSNICTKARATSRRKLIFKKNPTRNRDQKEQKKKKFENYWEREREFVCSCLGRGVSVYVCFFVLIVNVWNSSTTKI